MCLGASSSSLLLGASPPAGNQGKGKGETAVLSEAEGGPEGCQGKISREGATPTFFIIFQWTCFV